MTTLFRRQAERELPYAERSLANAKVRLDDLAARIVEYNRKDLRVPHAPALLRLMQQTYELQMQHVETLRREAIEGL
jgi:hypothetical protein